MKNDSLYIRLFEYGNQDVSGDTGMHNGLMNAWLSSSLAISPKEQNHFLNKLVTNTLPISADAIEKNQKYPVSRSSCKRLRTLWENG